MFGMYQRNVWQESIILFALVVLAIYAVSLTLTLISSPAPNLWLTTFAGTLFLIVTVLTLWLRNISEDGPESHV